MLTSVHYQAPVPVQRPFTWSSNSTQWFGVPSEYNDWSSRMILYWDTWLEAASWEQIIERIWESSLEKKFKLLE